MKKTIAIILVALGTTLSAQAQIVFTDSMMGQLAQVKVAVVDSTNAEPVPFASVYLTERKDSTINHFTLTDNIRNAHNNKGSRGLRKVFEYSEP